MKEHRFENAQFGSISALCALIASCSLLPSHQFDEAARCIPSIRIYALQRLSDLTAEERELIRSQTPNIAHANYMDYYFSWRDAAGRHVATIHTSPPPLCKPYVLIDQAK